MKIKVFSILLPLVNNSKKIHTIFLFYIYIYKFFFSFGCAGSSLLLLLSLDAVSGGYPIVAVHGLLIAVASLAVEHQTPGCPAFGSCNM